MSAHPVSDRRRGWCPGVRRPMETGDGLLVRLHPFAGRLTADQARSIAEAAREFGNGHLDITARGNLQIRGVSDETYPGLLALLEREGLAEPEGEGPNRLTIVSPLAGLDRIDRFDALALAQAIEDRAGHLDGLPAKFFVAVDGGGLMPLDAIGADLHLVATREDYAIAFDSAASKGLHWIGATSPACAAEAVLPILADFAEMRRKGRTQARRLRDLEPVLVAELAASAELAPAIPRHRTSSRSPRRLVPNAARACRPPRAALRPLQHSATGSGGCDGASASARAKSACPSRAASCCRALRASMSRRCLRKPPVPASSSTPDDPRLSLIACPGKPDCGSALTAAPADALRLASTCSDLLSARHRGPCLRLPEGLRPSGRGGSHAGRAGRWPL